MFKLSSDILANFRGVQSALRELLDKIADIYRRLRSVEERIDGIPPGSSITLPIDATDVSYDNSTSGLTATDVQDAIDELAASGGVSFTESRWQFTEFSANTTTGLGIWAPSSSFSPLSGSAAIVYEAGYNGVWELTGGLGVRDGYRVVTASIQLSIHDGLTFRCVFKTASSATNKGAFIGFVAPTQNGSAPSNGLLLDYDATSQNATFTAYDGGSPTAASSSYALTANTWYVCDIVVGASSARCLLRDISGSVLYDETISSGIPYNDAGKTIVPGAAFYNRTLATSPVGRIDYIGFGPARPSWLVLP